MSDMSHDESEDFLRKVHIGRVTEIKFKKRVIGTKFYLEIRFVNLTVNRKNPFPEKKYVKSKLTSHGYCHRGLTSMRAMLGVSLNWE